MAEQTTEGSCHRVYGYSITVRVWTSRAHGLLSLTTEEGAREEAHDWVAQQMPAKVADAVATIDNWAKDITCAPPCERHEQRTVKPVEYTFRDVTDSVVECTGRYDIDDTIVCEEPMVAAIAPAIVETAQPARPVTRWLNPWVLASVVLVFLVALLIVVALVRDKPTSSGRQAVAQSNTTVQTTTLTSATPSSATANTKLTGSYEGRIEVEQDPFGHAPFIGPMPTALDVAVSRHADGVITVQVTGPAPFVTVTGAGNYNVEDGSFSATGDGTVTDRKIPVTATLTGNVIDGQLTGTLTFTGTPNGPISYRIVMKRVAGP